MRNKLILEAVGVFFLCLAALLGASPLPTAALLAALVYCAAPVAFPHFNPAVSLAFRLRGRLGAGALWLYLAVQLAAGAAALLTACLLQESSPERAKEALDNLALSPYDGMFASMVSEGLGSFLLVAVVLVVATSRRTAGNSYFGLAIGLAWLGIVGAFAELAPLVNPLTSLLTACRGWVEALFDDTVGAKALVTESLLLAKVAPRVAGDIAAQFAGAALAAGLFRSVLPEER
ncbi:MAG: hypothetical protein RL303_1380 [Verrucomicrobiota bacterium]|jgi:aquaporin Z